MPDAPDRDVDPGLREFTDDPRLALRPPPPHVPLEKFRAAANRFLMAGRGPDILDVQNRVIGTGPVAVRLYRPSPGTLPVIAFIHGGGFVFGNLDTHDAMCRHLALLSGAVVMAIDYRLAPEAPFPQPLHDCHAALAWLHDNAASLDLDATGVALAGDSAGGQLATATALMMADESIPLRHLGLFYPLVDPACATESFHRFGSGYMLTDEFLRWSWDAYGSQGKHLNDPLFDLTRANLSPLPPTTIITAALDPLRDEGQALAVQLKKAGVEVAFESYAQMIHGFVGLPRLTDRAHEALARMASSFTIALSLPQS